ALEHAGRRADHAALRLPPRPRPPGHLSPAGPLPNLPPPLPVFPSAADPARRPRPTDRAPPPLAPPARLPRDADPARPLPAPPPGTGRPATMPPPGRPPGPAPRGGAVAYALGFPPRGAPPPAQPPPRPALAAQVQLAQPPRHPFADRRRGRAALVGGPHVGD